MSVVVDADLAGPVGTRIGGIYVERRLAEGGMGTVYLGRDERLQRAVAIKSISNELRLDPEIRARFLREARVLSRLKHPNICEIYGYEESADSVYLVLEYIDGHSLRAVIDAGVPMGLRDRFAATLAEVLQTAHGAGVVHRDLKPENVMLSADGELKVLDFGIARFAQEDPTRSSQPLRAIPDRDAATAPGQFAPWPSEGSPTHTRVGSIVGTPRYMSPEQARGEAATPASDIFALGLILFELYTGQHAYPTALEGADLLERQREGRIEATTGVTGPRRRLLERMLSKVAPARPTATEVAQELRRIKELPRRRIALAAAVIGLVAGGAAVTKYVADIREASTRAEQARVLAVRAAARAERAITDQYEEQGRQALLSGEPLRAMVYLSEAYGRGATEPGMQLLLGRATHFLEKQVASIATGGAYGAEYSPDGRFIVTYGIGPIEVWDGEGRRIRAFAGHKGRVWNARWLPDSDGLVSGGADGDVHVWSIASGTGRALRGHHEDVMRIALSADGKTAVTGGFDRTIRVWDVASGAGRILATLGEYATAFALAPDGRTVLYGTSQEVGLLDVPSGRRRVVRGPGPLPLPSGIDSTGTRALVADYDGGAYVWRIADGKLLLHVRAHPTSIWRASWSADGKVFVTASQDHTARVWDGATGQLLATMIGHKGGLNSADLDASGDRLVTTSTDGTAAVWDAHNGRLLSRLLGHGSPVNKAAFAPGGERVVTIGDDDTMRFWDPIEDDLVADVDLGGECWGAALAGDALIAVEGNRDLTLRDPAGGAVLRRYPAPEKVGPVPQPYTPAVSPDGTRIASLGERSAILWDRSTGERLLSVPLPSRPSDVVFSPDGATLLVGTWEDGSSFVDAASGAVRRHLPGAVAAVGWQPGGALALTVDNESGAITILDAASGAVRAIGRDAGADVATFSPDGTLIASAGSDSTVKLWKAADGAPVRTLAGHVDQVTSVAFSPDGRFLASGSHDGTARIWDVATGKLLYVLGGHTKFVFSTAWSADGQRLMTASNDGHVRTWDVRLEQRDPRALARLLRCRVPLSLADGLIAPARTLCE